MPRRRPGRRREAGLPPLPFQRRVEAGADGFDYEVRPIPAARAVKIYRCPGCDHEIRTGTAHVAVWRVDDGEAGLDDRRHWHTACWANRATRGPTRKWS
ncbi:hypothetical protein ORI20_32090 [Mycobacterium sp. CVI_P3]|uniref:ATP/GTP-binding protein n=1 Tax=Mycobacterium pinniadriaticum TaxID=2994102 RepID=A0ABT3SP61_9MYCO|nr:hypothetical protein [Mycobacterium pinniadriaticum]MCX2934906.1 hypothetical protein [Mycobacterium pinniadriaticum]MCX2941328.1 hypothetical protein [Mycobacterium pinniadriaticum]